MASKELTNGTSNTYWQSMNPTDFIYLMKHRRSLLVLPVVALIAMGIAYISKLEPFFKVQSRILVQRKGMPVEDGAELGREDEFLATQVEILASPAIVQRVARQQLEARTDDVNKIANKAKASDSSPPPTQDELIAECVDKIMSSLKVKRVMGTNVLNLSFRADKAEIATGTVLGIIQSYQEYLRDSDEDSHLEIVKLLTGNEKELRDELNDLNEKYYKLRADSPLLGGQGKDAVNIPWKTVEYYNQQLADAKNLRIELEYQIRSLLDVQSQFGQPEDSGGSTSDFGAASAIESDPLFQVALSASTIPIAAVPVRIDFDGEDSVESTTQNNVAQNNVTEAPDLIFSGSLNPAKIVQRLIMLQAEVHKLRLEFGESHPDVEAAREQIRYWKGLIHTSQRTLSAQQQRRLEAIRDRENQYSKLSDEKLSEAKALDVHSVQEKNAWDRIQRVQESHQAILTQVRALQLNGAALSDGQGRVSVKVLEGPLYAKRQVWPTPPLLLTACAVVGLAIGASLIGFFEFADAKVWSEAQVQGAVNYPISGAIPVFASNRRIGRDSIQRCRLAHDAPGSAFAEAIRTLRTRLNRLPHDEGLVIQLTSPVKGEGKSTVAANLAFSFSQLGRKVIVVDADLRGGALHHVFNVSSEKGLTAVLRGTVDLEDAIQTSTLANIDVLACGPAVSDPAELLAGSALDSILNSLRQHYDLVLLDTPPVLLVSDSLVIAPKADGVLLSVTVGRSSMNRLHTACELLETIGATMIGVVVNQLRNKTRSVDLIVDAESRRIENVEETTVPMA